MILSPICHCFTLNCPLVDSDCIRVEGEASVPSNLKAIKGNTETDALIGRCHVVLPFLAKDIHYLVCLK